MAHHDRAAILAARLSRARPVTYTCRGLWGRGRRKGSVGARDDGRVGAAERPGRFQSARDLLAQVDRDLPALARELIPHAPTATASFLAAPDHPDEHKPEWHQFGIITHT